MQPPTARPIDGNKLQINVLCCGYFTLTHISARGISRPFCKYGEVGIGFTADV